jgi:hypothetical protein
MPDMKQFLATFAEKLNTKPKVALDYVFGEQRSNLKEFAPDQEQTGDFIKLLTRAVKEESKDLSGARCVALELIASYNKNPPKSQFKEITPSVFAFQLAARVREPSLIDQTNLGICGSTAVVISLARLNPLAFVQYAISLMTEGSGYIYQMKVEPSKYTMNGKCDIGALAPADLVVAGSLGIQFSWLGKQNASVTATEIVEWLKNAKLASVLNKTWPMNDEFNFDKLTINLIEASTDVSKNRIVIVGIDGEIAELMLCGKKAKDLSDVEKGQLAATRKSGAQSIQDVKSGPVLDIKAYDNWTPKSNKKPTGNHWALVTRLVVTTNRVDIKLYSWGRSVQRIMALDEFLPYYCGYITGHAM